MADYGTERKKKQQPKDYLKNWQLYIKKKKATLYFHSIQTKLTKGNTLPPYKQNSQVLPPSMFPINYHDKP